MCAVSQFLSYSAKEKVVFHIIKQTNALMLKLVYIYNFCNFYYKLLFFIFIFKLFYYKYNILYMILTSLPLLVLLYQVFIKARV